MCETNCKLTLQERQSVLVAFPLLIQRALFFGQNEPKRRLKQGAKRREKIIFRRVKLHCDDPYLAHLIFMKYPMRLCALD